MAAEYSGYDYEEDPVMWDSLEDNFADLNESPDYEALSDLPLRRRSNFGRVSEEFTTYGASSQVSRENGGHSDLNAHHELQRHVDADIDD
jgi:hypothetical protein